MKKNLLRIMALLLVVLLTVGTAAGCGKKEAADDSSADVEVTADSSEDEAADITEETEATAEDATGELSEDSTASDTDTVTEATTDSAAAKAETAPTKVAVPKTGTPKPAVSNTPSAAKRVDLKGYTIKIASWMAKLDPKLPDNIYYEKAVQREKEVKAKYNIKIKYVNVPGQGLRDKLPASVLAGDPVGDLVYCRSGWVLPTFSGKMYIQPADKYFDISDPLWNPYITKQAMYKGHVMGVEHGGLTSWMALLYNRSMIQKLGLPDPQTLVSSKKWTWNKFVEYAKACAKDNDSDGKLDVYGSHVPDMRSAIASNGSLFVSAVNGKDVFTGSSPASVEALNWVQSVVKHGITGGNMSDFTNGKVGFANWGSWNFSFANNMKDKWGVLPYPMGPKAKDYAAWWDEVKLMTIPASSKHPKEAAAIWADLSRWYPGVAGRDSAMKDIFENNYKDTRDVNMALYIASKFALDKYFAYNQISIDIYDGDTALQPLLEGKSNKTIEQWMKENGPRFQNMIDDLWATLK